MWLMRLDAVVVIVPSAYKFDKLIAWVVPLMENNKLLLTVTEA